MGSAQGFNLSGAPCAGVDQTRASVPTTAFSHGIAEILQNLSAGVFTLTSVLAGTLPSETPTQKLR